MISLSPKRELQQMQGLLDSLIYNQNLQRMYNLFQSLVCSQMPHFQHHQILQQNQSPRKMLPQTKLQSQMLIRQGDWTP